MTIYDFKVKNIDEKEISMEKREQAAFGKILAMYLL